MHVRAFLYRPFTREARSTLILVADMLLCMQCINSGAIECKEGGGHFRPNKHAEIARDIFRALERCLGEPSIDPSLRLLARKVQTK